MGFSPTTLSLESAAGPILRRGWQAGNSTSEAWEASVLPLNYALSLTTILLRIDPPHSVHRNNWINGLRHSCGKRVFHPSEADLRLMRQAIDNYTFHEHKTGRNPTRPHRQALLEKDSNRPIHAKRRLGPALSRCRRRPRTNGQRNRRCSFSLGRDCQQRYCVQCVVTRASLWRFGD